tara:strand:+ start:2200 stop:2598 length:399 start_codon:yes stop_codon:yes gene_type:complete
MFTIVVDKKHSELLSDIRKGPKKIKIESLYKEVFESEGPREYWNWLHNDICSWINEYKPSYFIVTDKMKSFYLREFRLNIQSEDDVQCLVETSDDGIKYSGKFMWNKYVHHLKKDEFDDFYSFASTLLGSID